MIDPNHRDVGGNHDDVQLVDLVELGGLGVGGAGHARQTPVKLEEVLDRYRGHGLRFLLDGHAFLGLHRLVQAVGPLPADHLPPRVRVHDNHAHLTLVVRGYHVIAVTLVNGVSADRLLQQVRHVDVLAHVERSEPGQTLRLGDPLVGQRGLLLVHFHLVVLREPVALGLQLGQTRLGLLQPLPQRGDTRLVAGVADVALHAGHLDQAGLDLLVRPIPFLVLLRELAGQPVRQVIPRVLVVRGSGDDQRRPRLVDQDRVHLVHDRELTPPLDLLLDTQLHVVTQVVEPELRGRTVDHVARVGLLLMLVGLHVLRVDRAHREAQRPKEGE